MQAEAHAEELQPLHMVHIRFTGFGRSPFSHLTVLHVAAITQSSYSLLSVAAKLRISAEFQRIHL